MRGTPGSCAEVFDSRICPPRATRKSLKDRQERATALHMDTG